jgi:hypothetical protein
MTGRDQPADLDLFTDDDLDLLAGDPALGEDQPGWDWLRTQHPDIWNGIREPVIGFAEGIGDLPNVLPNTGNALKRMKDLHFGSGTGKIAEEDKFQPWFDTTIGDKSVAELNPAQAPGWEGWRDYGRMTGSVAPAGIGAMIAVPALSKLGSGVGAVADYAFGDPSLREMPIQDYMASDLPQGKWSQTGEFFGPAVAGGLVKGTKAIANSPTAAKIGGGISKISGPVAGAATLAKTGSLTDAYVAAKAAPGSLRALGKGVEYAGPLLKPLGEFVDPPGIAGWMARALQPSATESRRR